MPKHTMQDLKLYQALPLDIKIEMTKSRIRGWVREFGENGVYVSFSGGKDSTVLLDIVRSEYPNIPAVFVDVPTQYPELKEFAKTWDNVEILKPKLSFIQVCEKYGFPIISKEVSGRVYSSKNWIKNAEKKAQIKQSDYKNGSYPNYEELENISLKTGADITSRLREMYGKVIHKEKGVITNEYSLQWNKEKYQFLLGTNFNVSSKCCEAMKHKPLYEYVKKTGRKPITGQMTEESAMRRNIWIQNGCNAFDAASPISNPMSFWTEQDVLQYIKINNLPICSVYGDIVEDWSATGDLVGQMTISDLEGWEDATEYDAKRPPLKTTGCNRTGCVLCGFGCHLEKPGEGRFERLKVTHPGFYNLLDVVKNNGVTYREAIEWINEHGDFDIRL